MAENSHGLFRHTVLFRHLPRGTNKKPYGDIKNKISFFNLINILESKLRA